MFVVHVFHVFLLEFLTACPRSSGGGGVETNWDGNHDGGVVGRGGQFQLSENAVCLPYKRL